MCAHTSAVAQKFKPHCRMIYLLFEQFIVDIILLFINGSTVPEYIVTTTNYFCTATIEPKIVADGLFKLTIGTYHSFFLVTRVCFLNLQSVIICFGCNRFTQ